MENKTREVISQIFKDPDALYGLKEFSDLNIDEILNIFEKDKKYYLTCFKRDKEIQVFNPENNQTNPEEIIRQLWLYKLLNYFKYPKDRIEVEKDVQFGREIHAKSVDIVIWNKKKDTPYIVIETKKPKEEDGLAQLKSYLAAEGAVIGVWSNGNTKVVLYRPWPKDYETLREIPKVDQTVEDVIKEKLKLSDLKPEYDLKKIIETLEELVLAGAGVDSFNEIFKLIYAKLYDEKEAKNRTDHEVTFRKSTDPKITFETINQLFKESIQEWPGSFNPYEKIELSPYHLQVCIGELEGIQLLDAQLSIMDKAFEYLLTSIAKGSKGQYFTPRNVVDMAVKMLNPQRSENVIDPACGSGGFLIHAMWHVWRNNQLDHENKINYARKRLYGIDFDEKAVKIARALMLISGDGKSHVFKLNSLDTREWQGEESEKVRARAELQTFIHDFEDYQKNKENQEKFKYLNFDILLTNPPFAGEIQDIALLKEYDLGKNDKGKLKNKVERHILFIERCLDMLKPDGRMAIVLPQGVFNNTGMQQIRQFLFDKAKILAVVGLHGNTFKPHTGTKTSVLFLQKWNENQEPEKDYPIFMAVSQKSDKDNSGEYVYKKDEKGQPIFKGISNEKALDDDLDEIAEEFIRFSSGEKL
ncbi:MAG: N-6 DNA methylase [bacterium]